MFIMYQKKIMHNFIYKSQKFISEKKTQEMV